MVVKNMKLVDGIVIPLFLKDSIIVASDCPLRENEIKLFNIALHMVAEQLYFDTTQDLDDNIVGANVFFSKTGVITYLPSQDGIHELGTYTKTIIYYLNNLRKINDEDIQFATYIEEMVHHFWRIEDEERVKYKVIEIAKRYKRNINIDLFRKYGILK